MTTPFEYAAQNQNTFVSELKDLLTIPSISTDKAYKEKVKECAEWVAEHCRNLGMSRTEVYETDGHPVVYAEWLEAGPDAPTILAYGHYDVQPPGDAEEWQTPAFEPDIRNSNIYARGAVDDKGQMFMHLKVFESLMKTEGKFPVNLKLLIEGEEEIGSLHLAAFIQQHADMLKADVAVISDTGMPSPGQPAIVYGLRGITGLEIEMTGPNRELHSGAYGGTVHNPALALTTLLASMIDANGYITIPGFYDDVRSPDETERQVIRDFPYNDQIWAEETGAPQPWGEPEYSLRERIGVRPTLEINGLVSGHTTDGMKSIIPPKARAKITCRLVPDQKPEKIFALIREYVESHVPSTVRVEVYDRKGASPAIVARDSAPMQAAVEAYQAVFDRKPLFMREGGSIPVVSFFQSLLGLESIMIGFGLPDDNIHAPNEKFSLEQFRLGIETLLHFYTLLPAKMTE